MVSDEHCDYLTDDQIRERQQQLANRIAPGTTITQAYEAIDRGDYRGTILEAKLKSLRWLMEGFNGK